MLKVIFLQQQLAKQANDKADGDGDDGDDGDDAKTTTGDHP